MSVIKVLKGLSVVLPVIISTMATIMMSGVTYNMLVQKSCLPGGPPKDINKFICSDASIIDNITDILSTKAAIQAILTGVFGFLFGLLRDLTGLSKLLMYVGVLGELTSTCTSFLSAYYWTSSPWILAIIQALASGGFGENIMQIGSLCILMAESTPEELPMRLQVYIASTLTTAMLGGLVTTIVVTSCGYLWLFTLCAGFHVFALLLTVFLVKSKNYDRKSWAESLDVLKKVFKWRKNVVVLWMMLIALSIGPLILTCEGLYSSKYVQVVLKYSMYQSQFLALYGFLIAIIGSIAGPAALRKLFNCNSLAIGIIACLSSSLGAALHAFANNEVLFYLCGLAYFMKMASLPLPNTYIKAIVGTHELGTYLGINAIISAFLPIGMARLYQEVSVRTTKTWVGAFYLVSSGCFLFVGVLFSISYALYVEPQPTGEAESKENLGEVVENGISALPEEITTL